MSRRPRSSIQTNSLDCQSEIEARGFGRRHHVQARCVLRQHQIRAWAATARAMSLRTLSFVRAEFGKRVSPFMIALGRTVSTIVRLKISKMLVSGLPLPVRQRLLEALKQRVSGIHDALFRPD